VVRCGNAVAAPYDGYIMKFSSITASFLLAVGLTGGIFAVPAQADPAVGVDDFLTTLDGLGLGDIDPAKAVEVGQSLCPMLAERGQNTADIASTVSDAIGRPLGPATIFTGAAISFLCPKAVESLTGDLVSGNLPFPLLGG
jgi:hypothetical protein